MLNVEAMGQQVKQKIAKTLLEEVKTGKLGWYYISVAGTTFLGGYLIQARGPTEAWKLLHGLGWYVGGSTETHGPLPEEVMERVPEEIRWRRLSRDEAINLGK